jgi:hypothetical protein
MCAIVSSEGDGNKDKVDKQQQQQLLDMNIKFHLY